MPRPLRVHLEGALYYVTCRAMEQTPLFRGERDHRKYLELLMEAKAQYGFKLFAYVLLPDHLHLCLELTGSATLSAIMHSVNSRYTKYISKQYGHSGHLFQQRFKSSVMEKSPYLLPTIGWLHLHAVRSGLATEPQLYRWSNYLQYAQPETVASPELADVLARLTADHHGQAYADQLAAVPDTEWQRLRELLKQPVIGSDVFTGLVQQYRKLAAQRSQQRLATAAQPAPTVQYVESDVQPSVAPGASAMRPLVTAIYGVAFVALCAAALYARSLGTFQDTLRVMAQERAVLFQGLAAAGNPGTTLAAFSPVAQLNGMLVSVELRSVTGVTPPLAQDQLEFMHGKFVSRGLGARGFSPSRVVTQPQSHGSVQWETVQTDRAGTMMHWEGYWDGRQMEGTLRWETPGRPAEQFTFISTSVQQTEPRSEI